AKPVFVVLPEHIRKPLSRKTRLALSRLLVCPPLGYGLDIALHPNNLLKISPVAPRPLGAEVRADATSEDRAVFAPLVPQAHRHTREDFSEVAHAEAKGLAFVGNLKEVLVEPLPLHPRQLRSWVWQGENVRQALPDILDLGWVVELAPSTLLRGFLRL